MAGVYLPYKSRPLANHPSCCHSAGFGLSSDYSAGSGATIRGFGDSNDEHKCMLSMALLPFMQLSLTVHLLRIRRPEQPAQ